MKKRVQTSARELLSRLREEIWPNEISVFERPQRLKYVRKLVRPKGCVFCAAADSKNKKSKNSKIKKGSSEPLKDHLVLYMGRKMMILLNKYPYNNGHLLIIPRAHKGDFLKLTDSELKAFQVLAKHSIKILKKVYQPQGFNLGMNLGEVSGAGIPDHIHYHVIPRWGGDTNFFPLIAQTKVVIQSVEDSYDELRPHFKKLEVKNVL